MELIDAYDENNNYLGYSLDRKEFENNNLWYHIAASWIMNEEGKVLLQQRAFTKKKNPGIWSGTGGFVETGEKNEDAIKREVYEEIGLKVSDNKIKYIETIKAPNPDGRYYVILYIIFTNYKEDDFVIQKSEVNKVKYYTIEEIEQTRIAGDRTFQFYNWNDESFNDTIELLKKYRTEILN